MGWKEYREVLDIHLDGISMWQSPNELLEQKQKLSAGQCAGFEAECCMRALEDILTIAAVECHSQNDAMGVFEKFNVDELLTNYLEKMKLAYAEESTKPKHPRDIQLHLLIIAVLVGRKKFCIELYSTANIDCNLPNGAKPWTWDELSRGFYCLINDQAYGAPELKPTGIDKTIKPLVDLMECISVKGDLVVAIKYVDAGFAKRNRDKRFDGLLYMGVGTLPVQVDVVKSAILKINDLAK